MATGGLNLSKEFFELLKAIGESKSKQEEDRIIAKEVARLKQKLESPSVQHTTGGNSATSLVSSGGSGQALFSSKKRAKEFLVRLLYVEMLGHEASFGYIKAVEMAASASLYHKRTGYLVCGACLPPDHEFRFMLVNQMQRDLQSPNVLECSGGVLACTAIITPDMVPAVSGEVTKLLTHDSATIRKKAIICLHRFHQLAPEVVTQSDLEGHLRRSICDTDPSVMASSLNVLATLATHDPNPFKELVPSLVSILKQVGDHRLPADYDYHRLPGPWIQLKLVRILGVLGRADATTSSGMYEILSECMKKADNGINAGYAIVYECIKTIVSIYPNPALLDAAADAIARFIQSRSQNLKYLGVKGLAMIVESHPQYAAQHQIAVMDCLEDPDETLQRKTLDLLYRMTNPVNIEFIADKLLAFLSGTTDLFLKRNLTKRVCTIAERYAPNNAWYIRTITTLFEVAGDMVSPQVAQNLMSLIAEGTGEGDESDMLLRQHAVELYVTILRDKPLGSLPTILLETMAWCLGEYGYLSSESSLEEVLDQLCQLAATYKAKLTITTRRFLVTAIMKLVAQAGTCPPEAAAVIDDYTKSSDCDLQQRCLEFQTLLTTCPHLLPEILPVDASAEDVDVDVQLSFLDGYVQECLTQNGARPYEKPEDDDDDDDDRLYGGSSGAGHNQSAFKMTPYEKPPTPSQMMMLSMSGISSGARPNPRMAGVALPPGAATSTSTTASGGGTGTTTTNPATGTPDTLGRLTGELSLNTRNVANVWGRGGLNSGGAAASSSTTTAVASGVTSTAATTAAAPSPQVATSSRSWESSPLYGGASSTHAAPQEPPVKTAEQLERERQAAALFGGIIPGAAPPPPPPPPAPRPPPRMPVSVPSAVAPPAAVQPQVAAPAPPPTPEVVDLLDMSLWDSSPGPAASATASTTLDHVDHLSPALVTGPQTESSIGLVETVSEDDGGVVVEAAQQQIPVQQPQQEEEVDPFAGAGLLGGYTPSPTLPSLSAASLGNAKFEYLGTALAPLPITTAQFGSKWMSCPATAPVSATSSRITNLEQFMGLCTRIGAHAVEAIPATQEGIAAGMMNGGAQLVLIHGKITTDHGSGKIIATVKSTDQGLAGSLAMYLQTMLR